MVDITIKQDVYKENVKLLVSYITSLRCKYSVITLDNNDISIVLIEDVIDINNVSLHNRIVAKTTELNMFNGITIIEYFNDNSLPITTVNVNDYIRFLENDLEQLLLKKFNLNNDLDMGKEDYNGEIEEEINDLEEMCNTKSNYIELMYSYTYRLGIAE